MSSTNSAKDSEILLLTKNDSNDFTDLLINCFGEGLERNRVNLDEVAKIMRKINKPVYRFMMKIMNIKMVNYGIRRDGKLVSALTLSMEKKNGNIGNVMTHPDFRRQGLAKKLFRHAVSVGKSNGLKKITLDVHAQNSGAIKLYKKEGFKNYYHTGRLVLNLLEKEIPITKDNVILKDINKIDFDLYDSILNDCYPRDMLKDRNRRKMAKDYIPSAFIRFIAGKAAGQKIFFYEMNDVRDEKPKGYLNASISRIEEGIKLSSPLVKNENVDLVIPAIAKIIPLIDRDTKIVSLNLSMHRKGLIKKLVKAGFELTDESLYMNIKFDKENGK